MASPENGSERLTGASQSARLAAVRVRQELRAARLRGPILLENGDVRNEIAAQEAIARETAGRAREAAALDESTGIDDENPTLPSSTEIK